MPSLEERTREIRRDARFGRRYLLGNLLYFVPGIVAFYFAVEYFWVGGWRLWLPAGLFFACVTFGMFFDWWRFRNYRCPLSGNRIRKPTLKQVGVGTPRRYYCGRCDIEWDTGLRVAEGE